MPCSLPEPAARAAARAAAAGPGARRGGRGRLPQGPEARLAEVRAPRLQSGRVCGGHSPCVLCWGPAAAAGGGPALGARASRRRADGRPRGRAPSCRTPGPVGSGRRPPMARPPWPGRSVGPGPLCPPRRDVFAHRPLSASRLPDDRRAVGPGTHAAASPLCGCGRRTMWAGALQLRGPCASGGLTPRSPKSRVGTRGPEAEALFSLCRSGAPKPALGLSNPLFHGGSSAPAGAGAPAPATCAVRPGPAPRPTASAVTPKQPPPAVSTSRPPGHRAPGRATGPPSGV